MRQGLRVGLIGALLLLLVPLALSVGPAPAQPADPARHAVRTCPSANSARERACYERVLLDRLREGGAGPALELLDRLAQLDDDVRRDGHLYAHGIGIAALDSPEQVGRIFASCTPGWQSGCYHGVIQSYFLATRRAGSEVTTASVDALCADHRGASGDFRLLFQCTHGLGHGLTMFHGHDLRRALVSCDLLSRPGERESCYGGAFMENIVNATNPHHSAAGGSPEATDPHAGHAIPAGHDAHGQQGHAGHGGHSAAAGEAWRALDPDDLHYPCSVVAEKYQDACYTIQTAAMLHHTRHDVSRTAAECGRAPARLRRTCFVSLGRDVSAIAGTRLAQAVRLCGLAAEAFEPACHEGVVQALINMDGNPADGVPYCRAIETAASKENCYDIVGRQALGPPDGEARREQVCRGAEPDFLQACLGRETTTAGVTVTASLSEQRRRSGSLR